VYLSARTVEKQHKQMLSFSDLRVYAGSGVGPVLRMYNSAGWFLFLLSTYGI
jgi:hypothetical protein